MTKSSESAERLDSTFEKIPSSDIVSLLEHYSITTVPKSVYEWRGYRYTNAADAIAAAKREESA